MEVVTISAEYSECRCVGKHVPLPRQLHRHHIIPLSYGGRNRTDNTVDVCPTTHYNIHELLSEYEKAGGRPPGRIRKHYSDFVQYYAEKAWAGRADISENES